jgi:MurNAc alpha-1-phosphate uridylyltransferase
MNGDVFTEFDFSALIQYPILSGELLAHLVLVPTPAFKTQGDFGLTSEHRVTVQGDLTFAGVSLLDPKIFAGYAVERLPLAPILREAMTKGQVSGERFSGYWSDIGTLERLERARLK